MTRKDNSAASQRQRILDYLYIHNRLSTITAREELDVMHPAARVKELKDKFGFAGRIVTEWRVDTNEQGNRHRNALYVLLSNGQGNDHA